MTVVMELLTVRHARTYWSHSVIEYQENAILAVESLDDVRRDADVAVPVRQTGRQGGAEEQPD